MKDIERLLSEVDAPRPMPQALKDRILESVAPTATGKSARFRIPLDQRAIAGIAAAVFVLAGVTFASTRDAVVRTDARPLTGDVTRTRPGGMQAAPVVTAAPSAEPGRLTRFDSDAAFLAYVKRNADKNFSTFAPMGVPSRGMAATNDAQGGADFAAAQSGANSAPHSESNVQEAGVDEADLVKTDGRRIYFLSGSNLRIFDLAASPPRLLRNLVLEGATNMFLIGGNLAVFDSRYADSGPIARIRVIDTNSLKVTSSTEIEGSVVGSRSMDGVMRVAVTTHKYPRQGPDQQFKSSVEQSKVSDWLPSYAVERSGSKRTDGLAVTTPSVYYPNEDAGTSVLTLFTFDPTRPGIENAQSVMGSGDVLYSSRSNMYVTSGFFDPETGEIGTRIHKFDVTSKDISRYLASGTIHGTLLNQFSMSEKDGRLRLAATLAGGTRMPAQVSGQGSSERRFGQSESAVMVLEQRGDKLETIGSVAGLGPNEQIYSVRFIGDVGYVVTFRRTDPLYVVDLADPTRPRVAGELKIPGYSGYLHPVADGRLIGVGRDGTEDGQVLGPQVSLFDVSNPAAPKRLAMRAFPASYQSEAEYDHLSVLFWQPTSRLVIPMLDGHLRENVFGGAVTMTIGRDSISEPVELNHNRDTEPWTAAASRSVVIGGRLITLSPSGALVSDLNTLAEQVWIPTP